MIASKCEIAKVGFPNELGCVLLFRNEVLLVSYPGMLQMSANENTHLAIVRDRLWFTHAKANLSRLRIGPADTRTAESFSDVCGALDIQHTAAHPNLVSFTVAIQEPSAWA